MKIFKIRHRDPEMVTGSGVRVRETQIAARTLGQQGDLFVLRDENADEVFIVPLSNLVSVERLGDA